MVWECNDVFKRIGKIVNLEKKNIKKIMKIIFKKCLNQSIIIIRILL